MLASAPTFMLRLNEINTEPLAAPEGTIAEQSIVFVPAPENAPTLQPELLALNGFK